MADTLYGNNAYIHSLTPKSRNYDVIHYYSYRWERYMAVIAEYNTWL